MPQDQFVQFLTNRLAQLEEKLDSIQHELVGHIAPLRDDVTTIKAQLAAEEKMKSKTGSAIQGWIGIAFASLLGLSSLLVSLFKHEAK